MPAAFPAHQAAGLTEQQWIVCQIGAREHYVLAAELHARGRLAALLTDAWASPGSLLRGLAVARGGAANRVRERYATALQDARVLSEGTVSLQLRALQSSFVAPARSRWAAIMSTNEWFGARMAHRLERSGLLDGGRHGSPAVFAYSYAAREIFRVARRAGCRIVLGQIDPGPVEDELVADVARRNGVGRENYERPPAAYWDNWREECALADLIVVNSRWSADQLPRGGIDASKVRVVPLAYQTRASLARPPSARRYPEKFTAARPLRLLFLGKVNLRKGAMELLQAMRSLAGAPIRLTMVGPVENDLRARFADVPQVEWIGAVARGEVAQYYRHADIFLLPTHSDGFALTQLEAQAHALPVFASSRCGDVVYDGVNGRLIDPLTTQTIAELLQWALAHPDALALMSAHATERLARFTTERAVDALLEALASRIDQ